MSKASDIAAAITARLEAITVAGGYQTDIGENVLRGKRKLEEGDLPCAVIVEGDDSLQDKNGALVKLGQAYMIEGHTACDPDNPNDAAHLIIADIKRAIFEGEDNTLGGLARDVSYAGRTIMTREDGLNIVAAAVEITVTYVENLSSP